MAELFCAAVRPGSVVVDIGAHLGFFTLLAAHLDERTDELLGCEALAAIDGYANLLRAPAGR